MNSKKTSCLLALITLPISSYAMDQNIVNLYLSQPGIESIEFTFLGYKVTDGVEHDESLSINKLYSDHLELAFNANRKGSTEVADDFKAKIGKGAIYGLDAESTVPAKLNFYFYGYLKVSGYPAISYPWAGPYTGNYGSSVYIAQGYNDADGHYNWWIGSPDFAFSATTGNYPFFMTTNEVTQSAPMFPINYNTYVIHTSVENPNDVHDFYIQEAHQSIHD